jgi:hypothetical protein
MPTFAEKVPDFNQNVALWKEKEGRTYSIKQMPDDAVVKYITP